MSSVSRSVGRPVTRSVLAGQLNNLTQLIKSLFSLGEQGFAYDPNDLTTLYQDAAGTVPVTAQGQPVGLILDKSKGLTVGAELNATALPKITGNAPVATYDSTTKVGTVNRVDVSNQSFVALTGATGGRWYKVSIKNTGSTQIALRSATAFAVDTTLVSIAANSNFTGYVYIASNYVLGIASALGEGTFIVNTVKEIAGNHAYQPVSASRPVLGRHPVTGVRNLVHYSELSSGWTVSTGGTGLLPVKSYGAPAPDGSNTASSILLDKGAGTTTSDQSSIFFPFAYAGESSHTLTVWMKTTDGSNKKVLLDFNGVAADSGTVSLKTVTGVWQQFEIKLAATDTGRVPSLRLRGTFGTDNSASLHVWHPQLEAGLIATPYQKTDARLDISENGVADAYYLKFDGVDDFLATNNIDFTMTDKISLFAGVRKLSDVNTGIVAELSTRAGTSLGAFVLYAPFDPMNKGYGFRSVGTLESTTMGALPLSPTSNVLAAKSSIAQDTLTLRVDSLRYGVLTQDQGTGNYGNYPLYIGRRGGTSLPFNGHLYSLIGISRLTTDSETIALEKAIAKNVGVTL